MKMEYTNDMDPANFIEELTSNCDEVQQTVLAEILSQNVETEYLKRHGMSKECADRESFKSKVPVVTYEDLLPDIQRIIEGDTSPILCANATSLLIVSSGTSGGINKLFPTNLEDLNRRFMFNRLMKQFMKQSIPGRDQGKSLNFMFTVEGIKTPSGIEAEQVLNFHYHCHQFRELIYDDCISPYQTVHCRDFFQSMYTQLLCGLYQRHEVVCVETVFPSSLIRAIQFLQLHCDELCNDISSGTLSPKVTDPALRACLIETFMHKPDPELAQFISLACKEENLKGIIKRIWPNTKYVKCALVGSMAQYIPALDYYSGGSPLVSPCICGSESEYGLNLNPLCDPSDISYTVIPTAAYFEFLPVESEYLINGSVSVPPQPMDLANVEIGKEYEILVTNYTGLYRFRVGDVVRVTGFHNSTPQFKFVGRKNVILSIHTVKTYDSDLQKAVDNMYMSHLQPLGISVADYTSYADITTTPGHYVVFVELVMEEQTQKIEKGVLDNCCLSMEEALDDEYKFCRVKEEAIGPLEIRVVQKGTFDKLMDSAISKGASISQYKVPRSIKSTSIKELLDSQVVSTHFSPSLPLYTGSL